MAAAFEPGFAQALLDTAAPVPRGVVAGDAREARRRFAVHRNNVVAGLVKTIETRFPAVQKIVGDDFFAAMARAFVIACPPRSPVLASFGDEFAAFIGAFEPARELPYLADVARLEAARTRAYHAADAAPVGAADLAGLDAAAIAGLRIKLHPSVQIVRSQHPIVTIWAMNSGERTLAPIETWAAEDALIVRPNLDVEVRLLPPGGAVFLHALAEGRSLGEAAARAGSAAFDLTANLSGLIGWGLISQVMIAAPRGRHKP
jgi:Putative DNA-binding domain